MHGTSGMMAPLAGLLGTDRDVHVIAYPADVPLGYAALVAYVTERLPPGRFVILGESFSGPIAIEIAAREPARTAGLIFAPIHPAFSPLVNAVMLGKFTIRHPEIVAALRATLTEISAATARKRMTEALTVDKRPQLAATTCPLLYLAGSRDRMIRRHCVRTILAARPDTQLRQFDAPHMLLETHAPAAAAAIRRFCDELPS
jgi:pimeloyl-[acyl-carrier protein] methyl ester esterase